MQRGGLVMKETRSQPTQPTRHEQPHLGGVLVLVLVRPNCKQYLELPFAFAKLPGAHGRQLDKFMACATNGNTAGGSRLGARQPPAAGSCTKYTREHEAAIWILLLDVRKSRCNRNCHGSIGQDDFRYVRQSPSCRSQLGTPGRLRVSLRQLSSSIDRQGTSCMQKSRYRMQMSREDTKCILPANQSHGRPTRNRRA